jgi:hypothetical protein
MTYDFTTLSPDDFENLVADLLSREWGRRLESFKPGKDRGIDLRNTRVLCKSNHTRQKLSDFCWMAQLSHLTD